MKISKAILVAIAVAVLALPAAAQQAAAPQMDAQELILSTQGMDASTTVMLLIIALFVAALSANSTAPIIS
ncbi:MAG: hypothetical protein ACC619_11240 [Paracoccaceae bacterium]